MPRDIWFVPYVWNRVSGCGWKELFGKFLRSESASPYQEEKDVKEASESEEANGFHHDIVSRALPKDRAPGDNAW